MTEITLPEPKATSPPGGVVEKYRRFINDFPRYPDNTIIIAASASVIGEQAIHFRKEDIQEEVDFAKKELEQSGDRFPEFLTSVIKHVTNRYPGNPTKWQTEFLNKGIDEQTILPTVREQEAANCFHRNLIFSAALQEVGIEAKVLQGDWIETTRNRMIGNYEGLPYKRTGMSGVRFFEGEKGEYHAFTLVRHNYRYYLADAALWVKDDLGNPLYPVVKEVTEEELLERDVTVSLPNEKKRHYVFKDNDFEILQPKR